MNHRIIPILFDTGADVSIISDEAVAELNLPTILADFVVRGIQSQSEGLTRANIHIGLYERVIDLFIVQNPTFPILLGLDNIYKFRLQMNEKYEILQ